MEKDVGDYALGCCAPQGRAHEPHPPLRPRLEARSNSGLHNIEQAYIPAQTFQMGDTQGDGRSGDGERPVHPVTVKAFSIDTTTVTVADFRTFVAATGYKTEAEVFGDSAVFHLAVHAPDEAIIGRVTNSPWWVAVRGADWAHPGGPHSDTAGADDHPVVHVSWNDAQAYCAWSDRALPTEAQWEAASRGGLAGRRFPWGDDRDETMMNIWQGTFPTINTMEDGFLTTAPSRSYIPNAYGLWQTVGNVWEWCADWWDPRYYQQSPERDPGGPADGQHRALRGGSYLCHDSYCNRYRNAARSQNTPDSSMGNAGFRTVSTPSDRRLQENRP